MIVQRKVFFRALLVVLAAVAAVACLGFVADNPDFDSDWLPSPDLRTSADLPAAHLFSQVRPLIDSGSRMLPMESTLIYLERHEKSPPLSLAVL